MASTSCTGCGKNREAAPNSEEDEQQQQKQQSGDEAEEVAEPTNRSSRPSTSTGSTDAATDRDEESGKESSSKKSAPKYGDPIVLPPGKVEHKEPAPYCGPGWIVHIVVRKSGKPDRYWISPGGKRFRSMLEVERFLACLKDANGDEDAAYKNRAKHAQSGYLPPVKRAKTSAVKKKSSSPAADAAAPPAKPSAGKPVHRDASSDVSSESSNEFYYYKDNDSLLGLDDDDDDDDDGGPSYFEPTVTTSAAALARGKSHFISAPQAAAAVLINSADHLAYSWDGLKMDIRLGSAALNAHKARTSDRSLRSGGPYSSTVPPTESPELLSAAQALRGVGSLRPKTCLPPPRSGVFGVVQQNNQTNELWYGSRDSERFADEVDRQIHSKLLSPGEESAEEEGGEESEGEKEDEDNGKSDTAMNILAEAEKGKEMPKREVVSNGVADAPAPVAIDKIGEPVIQGKGKPTFSASAPSGPIVPYTVLARVYETLCSQDADDGSAFRSSCNYLTTSAVVDKLRGFENGFAELEMRERNIKCVGRELALVDDTRQRVARLLGYRKLEEMNV